MYTPPSDAQLRTLLQTTRRIAVVGLSPNISRPSYRVSLQMQRWGFDIVPVRPAITEVLGQPAYANLLAVPGKVDLVNVFRRAEEVDAIVTDAIAIGAPAIWLQQGIIHEAAAERAAAAGMLVVMDRCIMVEYARLFV
ncbi:CoA-binding protein [Chitinimonas sp. BJYL2]|uniref:CoA-binding protein n=1 Tax=Chitinimonas sp. BJYL2 TaxID=2976696 RepID=UPI0022B4FF47|nr:CoA-binding protein [Chitinimonas sp. BJYL2]